MEKVISSCGVVCSDCKTFNTECMGCPGTQGKPSWLGYVGLAVCPLYQCCVNDKGLENCIQCELLPCAKFNELKDPTMTDEEHEKTISDRISVLKSL